MKQNKFKLTPQVHKELIEKSKPLTPLQILDKSGRPMSRRLIKVYKGSELPADVETEGPVNPDKNYKVVVIEPVLVNHLVNLIDAYRTKGPEAVEKYCNQVNEISQRSTELPV